MRNPIGSPARFARNLVRRRIESKIVEYCNKLGPKRIEWCIVKGKLTSTLFSAKQEAEIKAGLAQWSTITNRFSDQELIALTPQWARDLVKKHGELGDAWLADLVAWSHRMMGRE